jgi:hypothetical protein
MERTRALAKELLPWGALAAFTGAAVWGDVGPEMRELLLKWGPGLLIFLVIAQSVPPFVRAAQKQADAMAMLARELHEVPRRDEFKFQDLLIGQELILRELAELKKRVPDGGRAS